ncbi:MAG: Gfo/Idh/MocA family protein [Promethearchaeota archaeon]
MPKNKKRTAVIGCGWFGRAHVRNFDGLSELVAVCDLNKDIANQVAKQYGVRAYNDVSTLLKEEALDAVSIVTPPKAIPEIGLEFAKKGVDVLLEKPCALKLSDLSMLDDYKDSVKIMPGFLELFNPVWSDLKEQLKDIGEVMTVNSSRIGLFPKRNWGIGVMMDLGVHDVYLHRELAKILFGDKTVVEIYSVFQYLSSDERYEDAIFVLLKFHKMATCISANWITPSKFRKLMVAGSEASLEADFITGTVKKIWGDDLKGDKPKSLETLQIPLRRDEPLKREISTFLNEKNLPVSLEDAHDVLKITLQALHKL